MIALYIVLALLVVLIAVILIRTAAFKPKSVTNEEAPDVVFDKDKAVNDLAELVKCKTVSYNDSSLEDDAEFEKLIGKLPELFPNVWEKCEFTKLPDRGLLFKWKAKPKKSPLL